MQILCRRQKAWLHLVG